MKEYDKAISDFNKVIDLKPTWGDNGLRIEWAYYRRELAYEALGQIDKAEADFEKVLPKNISSLRAIFIAGKYFMTAKNFA